jgi:hypothetical protein
MLFDGKVDPGRWQASMQNGVAILDYVLPLNGRIRPESLADTMFVAGVELVPASVDNYYMAPFKTYSHPDRWRTINWGVDISLLAPAIAIAIPVS